MFLYHAFLNSPQKKGKNSSFFKPKNALILSFRRGLANKNIIKARRYIINVLENDRNGNGSLV